MSDQKVVLVLSHPVDWRLLIDCEVHAWHAMHHESRKAALNYWCTI